MKKLYMTIAIFFGVNIMILSASCYTVWLGAYEDATEAFQSDSEYCASVIYGIARCQREANMAYSHSLNSAGDEYINCGAEQ